MKAIKMFLRTLGVFWIRYGFLVSTVAQTRLKKFKISYTSGAVRARTLFLELVWIHMPIQRYDSGLHVSDNLNTAQLTCDGRLYVNHSLLWSE
jgi:hypothetical protein